MAFNFNNDSRTIPLRAGEVAAPSLDSGRDALATDSRLAGDAGAQTAAPAPADAAASAAAPQAPSQSPAFTRFGSCRWQQPAEEGNAAFCTHREVKPYAGTAGFDADAWCPDCQYYKLRRAPKKRTPQDEYTY